MPRYRCPSCSTVVEAVDPNHLVCPSCGFGSSAPASTPAPYVSQPQYSQPGAYTPQAPGGVQPGYGPGPYAASQAGGYAPFPSTPGVSTAALVLGILALCIMFVPFVGWVLGPIGSIVALSLGSVGIKKTNQDPQRYGGKGIAVAGVVLGSIGLVIAVFLLIALLLFFDEIVSEFVGLGALLVGPRPWL